MSDKHPISRETSIGGKARMLRIFVTVVCFFAVPVIVRPGILTGHTVLSSFPQPEDQCMRCHIGSSGRAAEVVALHRAGTHGLMSVGCAGCHGGDAAKDRKEAAHAGDFIGIPDADQTLIMCGKCHGTQLNQFQSGRHSQQRRGIPRLDCAVCHGAHTIGNPPEHFSLTQFCAGCHGLEYLPALPGPFQDLLALSDQLQAAMRAKSGERPMFSEEIIRKKREIRRLTAEIIHPTDRDGGIERIPQILTLGETLKKELEKTN